MLNIPKLDFDLRDAGYCARKEAEDLDKIWCSPSLLKDGEKGYLNQSAVYQQWRTRYPGEWHGQGYSEMNG